jgi:hypothetical protein
MAMSNISSTCRVPFLYQHFSLNNKEGWCVNKDSQEAHCRSDNLYSIIFFVVGSFETDQMEISTIKTKAD